MEANKAPPPVRSLANALKLPNRQVHCRRGAVPIPLVGEEAERSDPSGVQNVSDCQQRVGEYVGTAVG